MSARDTRKLKKHRREKHRPSVVTLTINANLSGSTTNRTFIDEATFRFQHSGSLPTTRQQVTDCDGVIKFDAHNRLPVPGKFGVGCLFLRTFNGKEMQIQCCFGKVLFGHNAAGYTHLPRALKRVFGKTKSFVEETLNQPWTTPAMENVKLDRVSLTRHMKFTGEGESSGAVNHIQRAIAAHQLLALAHKPGETITTSVNPRICTVSFYVKEIEMRASATAGRNPRAQDILSAVGGWLRVEIRLTPLGLRKFGIETADRWNHDTADNVFSQVFADFGFLSLTPLQPVPGVKDPEMPGPLRRALTIVRAGTALDAAYAPSSARRLMAQASEYGIDLRAPPSPVDDKLMLLNPENRWVTSLPDAVKRLPGFDKQFGKPRAKA